MIVVAVLAFAYCLGLSTKTFPIAEGWYSVYSRMIIGGEKPYVDFEYLYTPLYLYIIAGFVAVFGEAIIYLRVLGVLLFTAIAIVSYFIFLEVFSKRVSVLCALVTVFVMQREYVQIFYDYIRFYDLFNYLGILMFLKLFKANQQRKAWLYAALSGAFLSLSFMIRQSSGLINLFFGLVFIVFLIVCSAQKKQLYKYAASYLLGAISMVLVMALCLLAGGMMKPFLSMVFGDAVAAKGGMAAILSNWAGNRAAMMAAGVSGIFLIGLLIFSIKRYERLEKMQKTGKDDYILPHILVIAAFLALIALIAPLCQALDFEINFLIVIFLMINLFVCAVTCLQILINRKKEISNHTVWLAILSGFVVSTAFGCATSGGFSFGQTALAFGVCVGLMYYGIKMLSQRAWLRQVAFALGIVFVLSSAAYKIEHPYNWWGLCEPSTFAATEYTDIEMLKGISMSYSTKEMVQNITSTILEQANEQDELYCFPQIPIFYSLTNISPSVKAVVPWFDVASDKVVLEDLQLLMQKNPRFMVIAFCGELVMSAHERLFREDGVSAQRRVYEWVNECIDSGLYTVAEEYNACHEENCLAEGDYRVVLLVLAHQ